MGRPGIFTRAGRALDRFLFGYDAAKATTRRKAPDRRQQSEDKELDTADRAAVISAAREVRRNFAIAAWGIRKHLDYVATFAFRARTPDRTLNRTIEKWLDGWADPSNFETTGRHSLYRWLRLAESSRTVDGDVLTVRYSDGLVGAVEADRIRTPIGPEPADGIDPTRIIHGVHCDKSGRPTAYAVHARGGAANSFTFERWVKRNNAWLHGYFDRFDQYRGISPLAASVNTFRDVYEAMDYATAKAKVSQLFALVTFRDSASAAGLIEEEVAQDETADPDAPRYTVDFGAGPVHLDLDPGDRAEFLESKSPAMEFQQHMQAVIAAALKGLDIPYSFYAENFSNYSGSRQALLQYEQSADDKRRENRYLLDVLTRWRLGIAVADREIVLPANVTVDQLAWEWMPAGIPWIDPQRDIAAHKEALGMRVSSRQRICRERNVDFFDVADELADEEAYLREKGLTQPEPKQPQQTTEPAQQ